ncbi:MAG TPA: crosslink repair DNA glycosylase YcaQ family protein [Chthoniobacterales bacterium]
MKPRPLSISLSEARAIALRAQGLADEPAPFGESKTAVLQAIRHLGYVQVDTISVIQRAHHHVLWSRVPDYRREMLHELQELDRAVFEYWNHAASYLPMNDFRFSLPFMRQCRGKTYWTEWPPDLVKAMRRVLRTIRSNGALMLRDVETKGQIEGWFNSSPDKIERRALHRLWLRGEVMIRSRQGFQKVFDLPERVLPEGTDVTLPTKREAAEFHARRALRALGVARSQELHYLRDADHGNAVRVALQSLIKRGEVIELQMAEFPDKPCFALRQSLELAAPLKSRMIRFLSPFDNLVIQRKRLQWLFGFDYTIEVYVPAAKRKFGYFVLPILWGDRIIGRVDAKASRPDRRLLIHHLIFEPDFADFDAIGTSLPEALTEFSRFQGCDEWEITKVTPSGFKVYR